MTAATYRSIPVRSLRGGAGKGKRGRFDHWHSKLPVAITPIRGTLMRGLCVRFGETYYYAFLHIFTEYRHKDIRPK